MSQDKKRPVKSKKPVIAKKVGEETRPPVRSSLISLPQKEFDSQASLPLLAERDERETGVVLRSSVPDHLSQRVQDLIDDTQLLDSGDVDEEEERPLHKAATFYLSDSVHEELDEFYALMRLIHGSDAPGKSHIVDVAIGEVLKEMKDRSTRIAKMKRATRINDMLFRKQEAKEHMARKKRDTWVKKDRNFLSKKSSSED